MGEKQENLKGLMTNGKTRLVILITAVVLIGFILIGVISMKKSAKNAADQGSVQTAQSQVTSDVPGSSKSNDYNRLLNEENRKKAEEAKAAGQTSLPVLTNNIDKSNDAFVIPQPAVTEEKKVVPVQPVQTQPVRRIQESRPNVPRAPVVADEQDVTRLEAQMSALMSGETPVVGHSEIEFPVSANQNNNKISFASGSSSLEPAASTRDRTAGPTGAKFVKAGTIVPAVLLTALNTDEPGPVLAEIVSGPLKGSRLIGTLTAPSTTYAQKVVLSFTTLTMPKIDHSFTISTFAVDPNTDRTAFASDVENHYLSRYGALFAAAFVTGYGTAMQNSNLTTITPPLGGATTIAAPPTSSQATWAGLAGVGNQLNSDLSQNANRPATIVVDAGLPIGVLFMADF